VHSTPQAWFNAHHGESYRSIGGSDSSAVSDQAVFDRWLSSLRRALEVTDQVPFLLALIK
jgi:hypothetical protein